MVQFNKYTELAKKITTFYTTQSKIGYINNKAIHKSFKLKTRTKQTKRRMLAYKVTNLILYFHYKPSNCNIQLWKHYDLKNHEFKTPKKGKKFEADKKD